jgi:hypothetical protein
MLLYAVDTQLRRGAEQIIAPVWEGIAGFVEEAIAHAGDPDQGIWEIRGEPQHFTASAVMCWVAAARGADLARERGDSERAAQWQQAADKMKAEILAKGVDERGRFRQAYENDELDASLLLLPIMGFLPPDDKRIKATVLAIADELTEDGLVLRYKVDSTDTGFAGKEGTFTICSWWLVTTLAMIGETDRARALCTKLLSYAGPLNLYAEEIDATTGEHLGNFPQAFTHLALIEAVSQLIEDEARPQAVPSPRRSQEADDAGPAPRQAQAVSRRRPSSAASRSARSRLRSAHRPSARSARRLCTARRSASGPTLAHTDTPRRTCASRSVRASPSAAQTCAAMRGSVRRVTV